MNNNNGFTLEVARGYLTSGIWGNIGKVLSFLNSLLVIYFLSVYDFGIYKLVLAFVGFAQIFLFSGFDGVIFNDIARTRGANDFKTADRIFLEYLFLKIFLSLLLFFIFFIGADFYYPSASNLIKSASIFIVLYALGDITEVFFKSTADFASLFKFPPLQEFLKSIFLIVGAMTFTLTVTAVIWIGVFAYIIAVLPFLARIIKSLYKQNTFSLKELLRFSELFAILKNHGKWGAATNIFSNLVTNIRPWLINFFVGTEGVGIYSVALGFVNNLASFMGLQKILSILAPREWLNQKRMEAIYYRGTKYATIAGLFIAILGGITVTIIIQVFYPKYLVSLPLFYIMVLSLILLGASDSANGILTIAREQKFLFGQAVLKSVLTITLNAVLLPLTGLYGAAFEYPLTILFLTALKYRKVKQINKELSLNFRKILTWDRYDTSAFNQLKSYIINILKSYYVRYSRHN